MDKYRFSGDKRNRLMLVSAGRVQSGDRWVRETYDCLE